MDAADQALLDAQRRDLYGTGAVREVRCGSRCGYRFLLTEEGWRGPWDADGDAVGNTDLVYTDDYFESSWGDCWRGISAAWRAAAAQQPATPARPFSRLPYTLEQRAAIDELRALVRTQRIRDLLVGTGWGTAVLRDVDTVEERFVRTEGGVEYRVRVTLDVDIDVTPVAGHPGD
ncbi:hypothetical protein [Kitasatospora sp. NPDC057198]|uniref:hypothetical protein n=1 Tax=Kitasatospora sp. NPDC057198 TaxID=3346046 RepID=UPI00363A8842